MVAGKPDTWPLRGNRRLTRSSGTVVCQDKLRLRSAYGLKILGCLIRGLEELKASDSIINMSEEELEALSIKICDSCYENFSYSRRIFKQKIFDIYTNLKRENNQDLRRKVLTGVMSIDDLINADTLQLAPDHIQKERLEEVEKHYIRNVIFYSEIPKDTEESTFTPEPESKDVEAAVDVPEPPNEADTSEMIDETQTDSENTSNESESSEENSTETEETEEDISEEEDQQIDKEELSKTSENVNEYGNAILEEEKEKQQQKYEDTKPRLPQPPECDEYTMEMTKNRIESRISQLPAYIAKPFQGPFQCGVRRTLLLMQMSPILLRRRNNIA